jgi:hypothetical protein
MLLYLLTVYSVGFLVLVWAFWLQRQIDIIRFFELLVWPLTLIVATIRVCWDGLLIRWERRSWLWWV